MKKITFVGLIILFTGCKNILKTAYAIKDPALETWESTQSYLTKNNIGTDRTLIFKDFPSFVYASQNKLLIIPNGIFFNSEGNFVPYNETPTTCNANVDNFIMDLKNLDQDAEGTKSIGDLLKLTKTLEGETPSFEKGYDVYVFITWARYVGRLNKEKAFDWVDLLEKAKRNGVNVKYYLLNCDLQEAWNMTEEQKEMLGI